MQQRQEKTTMPTFSLPLSLIPTNTLPLLDPAAISISKRRAAGHRVEPSRRSPIDVALGCLKLEPAVVPPLSLPPRKNSVSIRPWSFPATSQRQRWVKTRTTRATAEKWAHPLPGILAVLLTPLLRPLSSVLAPLPFARGLGACFLIIFLLGTFPPIQCSRNSSLLQCRLQPRAAKMCSCVSVQAGRDCLALEQRREIGKQARTRD